MRFNPFDDHAAQIAAAQAAPPPPATPKRRRTPAKPAVERSPISETPSPKPTPRLTLADLLPAAGDRQPEAAAAETVQRRVVAAFQAGGRGAVLPTAAEQAAMIRTETAMENRRPETGDRKPTATTPLWRRRQPVHA